ncbi:MAG: gluconokinase [Bacteroidetes bacterium]|nr:MAG: gluconokinase [Bacteroidota bacterium]
MKVSPNILILGVSGSGKTTVGRLVSDLTGLPFLDADDFHPEENIQKMSRGEALTDADRFPWLDRLNAAMRRHEDSGFVLACSALKRVYRERLEAGLRYPLLSFYLCGSFDEILNRIKRRKGHFMPESLLQSQFDTLEMPSESISLPIEYPPGEIAYLIAEKVGKMISLSR